MISIYVHMYLNKFKYVFSNGATASGLYVALSFIIEKMKLEQEFDPYLALRIVRRNRQQFVTHTVSYQL